VTRETGPKNRPAPTIPSSKTIRRREYQPFHEVDTRLDKAIGLASYALLGELDANVVLEGLVPLLRHAQRHLEVVR
jgi:hypothetical protein